MDVGLQWVKPRKKVGYLTGGYWRGLDPVSSVYEEVGLEETFQGGPFS
jgi:hypothetical protein